jgi:hypothetical protein
LVKNIISSNLICGGVYNLSTGRFDKEKADVPSMQKGISSVNVNTEEMLGQKIKSFDISESGKLLINFQDSLNIYDENTEFMYSISYINNSPGPTNAFWDENSVAVYFSRYSEYVCLSSDGVIEKAFYVPTTIKNNEMYNYIFWTKEKTFDNTTYISTSSRLVKIDKNGNELVVYQNERAKTNLILTVLCFIIALTFFVGFISTVIRHKKEKQKQNESMISSKLKKHELD